METNPSKEVTILCLVNKYSHCMGPGCSIPYIRKLHHIPMLCGGRQRATYHHVLRLDVGGFSDNTGTQRPNRL